MEIERYTIHAWVHSDDRVHDVSFDAVPWFEQAADDELVGLALVNWGLDYEADAVALYCEKDNDSIRTLMEHCRVTEGCGFECRVYEYDALAWLRAHNRYIVERDGALVMVRLDELKDEDLPPLVGLDDELDRAIAERMK